MVIERCDRAMRRGIHNHTHRGVSQCVAHLNLPIATNFHVPNIQGTHSRTTPFDWCFGCSGSVSRSINARHAFTDFYLFPNRICVRFSLVDVYIIGCVFHYSPIHGYGLPSHCVYLQLKSKKKRKEKKWNEMEEQQFESMYSLPHTSRLAHAYN